MAIVPTYEVQQQILALHRRAQDFDEGDLLHRLWRFRAYKRRAIPIGDLNLGEWNVDDDLVARFAALPAESMPPIVFDAIDRSIIDGIHRANAAARRGSQTIEAYVGLAEHLDPDWIRCPEDE